MKTIAQLHPTPQMARTEWTDLCGEWAFAFDDENKGLEECWQDGPRRFMERITVPFPPESPASGIGDTGFHPVVWYRRTFETPEIERGERCILHCGAVDYRAMVWINGQLTATHEGGQTPFAADITEALRPGDEQVVVIRAEDLTRDLAQPRGKQDWQERPHAIWYHRTTGIWQPVWLETVSGSHITSVRWTPDLDRGVLGLDAGLQIASEGRVRLRIRLSLEGVQLADDVFTVRGGEIHCDISLDLGRLTMHPEQLLWSPEHPNLLDATLSLLGDGDGVIDEVRSYAGLRSVSAERGRFLLNGRPYYLRMALEQGYWPESHLAAPSEDALRREVELAKELGFNGVRIHQKVEDPRYLYWCDRLGLLVWGEMSAAYVFSRTAVERLTREWMEVIARDASHPCIVAWVPLNESWGVPNLLRDPTQRHFVKSLYHLTKTLDPSRPVIDNDGWEHLAGDILSIHDYTFSGETIRERYGSSAAMTRTLREVLPQYRFVSLLERHEEDRREPIMLTEFGGTSYEPEQGSPWFGYGTVTGHDAFRDKYRELVDAVLDCPTISGFCYTQLTDTGQETNGLLTEQREPKIDPAVVRAINHRPSAAVPGDIVELAREVSVAASAGVQHEPGAPTGDAALRD